MSFRVRAGPLVIPKGEVNWATGERVADGPGMEELPVSVIPNISGLSTEGASNGVLVERGASAEG